MPIYTNIAGSDQPAPIESTPVTGTEGDLAAISAGYQQAPGVTLIQAGVQATRGGPMVSHDDAAKQMTDQGYDPSHLPSEGLTSGALRDIMNRQSILKRDAYVIARSQNGTVRQFVGGLVGGLPDPINLAATALAPEAKVGATFLEKAAVGGAVQGGVMGAASLAQMPASHAMGDEYKMSDVFQNVVLGALTGGVLHGLSKPSAAAVDFHSAVTKVFSEEGGTTTDTGGLTKFGISQKAYPHLDIANLTQEQASKIYKSDYWDAIGADKLPPEIRSTAFDAAVNQGVAKTKEMLAQSGGDATKFNALREIEYRKLAASDPAKYGKYLQGWLNRIGAPEGAASFGKRPAADPPAVQTELLKTAIAQTAEDSKVNVEPVRDVAMDEHWGVPGTGVNEDPYRTNPFRIADEHDQDVQSIITQAYQDATPKYGSAEHTDAPIINEKFTTPEQPKPVSTEGGSEAAGPRTTVVQEHLKNDTAELKQVPEGIRKEGEPETVAADNQIKQTADLHKATEAAVNCGLKRGTE